VESYNKFINPVPSYYIYKYFLEADGYAIVQKMITNSFDNFMIIAYNKINLLHPYE